MRCPRTRTTNTKENGFSQGKLIRIDNEFGAFVGCLDISAYVARHEVDTSAVGNKRPFEESLIGFKHYVESGRDEGLEIAIIQVCARVCLCVTRKC